MKFVHLHTHSHYSLLDGLPKIPELVARAKELGMDAIALTDHGNLYGAIEFYKAAKKAGIKPIIGVEAYVAPKSRRDRDANARKYHHLILLVQNETGWKNLLKLATKSHLEGFYYKPRMDKEILRAHHEGLIALSGCYSGEIVKAILNGGDAEAIVREYQDIFGTDNFFIEIGNHPNWNAENHAKVYPTLIELSRRTGAPLAATQDIHYLKPEDAEYHDILLAVQTGNTLDDPDRLTLKKDDFSMRAPEEMAALFKEIPEAIENTAKIADRCNLAIELGKIRLPKFETPGNEPAAAHLRALIAEKLSSRYPSPSSDVRQRIEYELSVIENMGFPDYFLIVQDFVNWAKERGIVVGPGRGSASGSIVSYILGITDLDPLKYDLIFERFLNPDRIQMPDIDIDITDVRRDEVLGYLKEKYGDDRVAHIITFGTMAARAAVRDVGRALDMSYSFCDQLAKMIPFGPTSKGLAWAAHNIPELMEMYETNPDAKRVIDGAIHLEGVARHASVHACGIVISKEPLTEYLPLQRAPQAEHVILTQFDMHSVEDLGLLKMDLLGLRNLTIIEQTARLVEELRGEQVDAARLPPDDKQTFAMLQRGDTSGVFQLESAGMTRYLKELKPTEFEDIVAMVSLYRPGPMELIPEYVARKHGEKAVAYLHPKLEPVLKKTYGIMIYQEQLMQAAQVLAGFTLAEADVLRKAVGKKIRSLLQEQKDKLIRGCVRNGIPQAIAEQFWLLVEPFDRYGFNRSHGAAYAMIAYETAYLKSHYPLEFMTALLNAESKDIDRITYLVAEAQKQSIKILPPDINRSSPDFRPEEQGIRFGLTAIKNVGANIVQAIVENRAAQGPFKDLAALIARIQHKDLNKKSLEALAKCGALDSLGVERNTIIQNLDEIVRYASLVKRAGSASQSGLFGQAHATAPLKLKDAPPATAQERLAWEKELLGLYVTDHPLNPHRPAIEKIKAKPIAEVLATFAENDRAVIAGIVQSVKRIVTKNGNPMLFAKVEDFGNTIEVVVFADTLAASALAWREGNPVFVAGRYSLRNGEPKIICEKAKEIT